MTSSGQVVYGTDPDGVTLKIVDKAGKARFMKADHTPKSGVWSLSLTPASDLGLGEYYRITAGGVVKEGALLENVGWVPFEEFDSSDPRVVASGGPGAGGGSGAYVASTGDETVAGVKTFTSSPVVPVTPTTDAQAASKKYVDDNAGGGGEATELWVSATDLAATFNSPTATAYLRTPAWIFENVTGFFQVGRNVQLPSGWSTFDMEAWWVNPSTESGTAQFDWRFGDIGEGVTLANPGNVSLQTRTAGAQNVITVSTIRSGLTVPASKHITIACGANNRNAADTLDSSYYLLGAKLKKAS